MTKNERIAALERKVSYLRSRLEVARLQEPTPITWSSVTDCVMREIERSTAQAVKQ